MAMVIATHVHGIGSQAGAEVERIAPIATYALKMLEK